MTDDFDVDALLEEPFIRRREKKKKLKEEKKLKRSTSKEKQRARSRSIDRNINGNDDKSYKNDRSFRENRVSKFKRPPSPNLTPLERDARTVYIWQMSHKMNKKDLYDFFSAVGKIRTVRLIYDPKTGRSKGISYIEFREIESAQLAISLSGTRLLGVPLQVQPIQCDYEREMEYQRQKELSPPPQQVQKSKPREGPTKIYVGSLHYNINSDMFRDIFEPFGRIEHINLVKDAEDRSQGYGYITFSQREYAKKAVNHLDGFELAGRPIKVSIVSDKVDAANFKILDEDTGKGGISMGATGRLALMAKLAEGTGIQMPRSALAQLHISQQNPALGTTGGVGFASATTAPNKTQCFLLSNMFDPHTANNALFQEIRVDVIEECAKYGGILHMFTDKTSAQGNVYVKCVDIKTSQEAVANLHGRFFSGRMITVAYVPVSNYHKLFPDSVRHTEVIKSSRC